MRPRIALTLSRPTDGNAASLQAYRERLIEANALPVDVFPSGRIPPEFDALLLSGGGDIDPCEYGEADDGVERATVDKDRDRIERSILDLALARGVPVLGICRGFQVLNWSYGGKLKQNVSGHRKRTGEVVPHLITPARGSLLAQICGEAPFQVNSRHHQVVEQVPSGLRGVAWVGEYVEAVEDASRRWVLGVQWHPETRNDPPQDEERARLIFDAFVKAAEPVAAR